jgi:hypothetical protein
MTIILLSVLLSSVAITLGARSKPPRPWVDAIVWIVVLVAFTALLGVVCTIAGMTNEKAEISGLALISCVLAAIARFLYWNTKKKIASSQEGVIYEPSKTTDQPGGKAT